MKKVTNEVACSHCGGSFSVATGMLSEQTVNSFTLPDKSYLLQRIVITSITCPHCGVKYAVQVDDGDTNKALAELREVMAKRLSYLRKNVPCPVRMEAKYHKLNHKLDFLRAQLAKKLDGSFYQSEEGKEQLDFCHRQQ